LQDVATLLQAIAAILWPLFAFTALYVFRAQIADIARRLKRGKLLGQEIELGESLDRLGKAADSVQIEVAALPRATSPEKSREDEAVEQDTVRQIVREAARSPKAALISLAAELERLAREVLATTGHLQGRRIVPIQQAIAELHQAYGLPSHVPSSLKYFWEARNRLIHGGQGSDEDILRAIDSGISILKALQAMPREINVVHTPSVPLYSDPELTTPINTVHGVILETHSPGGVASSFRVFPSSHTHFKKGKQVSWEWNMGLVVGSAWYRDPESGTVKQAWVSSAEFVGRHIDDL
jgi:hypothetical protein